MNFQSITFLMALPLIAVPIVLHFIDRRRRQVIDWGAMEFLREASVHKTSRRRLRQWMLLLTRVAAIALLVLALSRPMVSGGWWSTDRRQETVFILDNSLSMARLQGGRSLFEEATSVVQEEFSRLDDDDHVHVLLTSRDSDRDRHVHGKIGNDAHRMNRWLEELLPSGTAGDVLARVRQAVHLPLPTAVDRREVVVITDRQASDWHADDRGGWKRLAASLKSAPVATTVRTVDVARPNLAGENIAVTAITASPNIVGPQQTFRVAATISNLSDVVSPVLDVVWMLGDDEQHRSQLGPLDPRESREVQWTSSIRHVGTRVVSCRITSRDVLPADDENRIIIPVVEQVPILIIETTPGYAEEQQDAWFLKTALGRAEQAGAEWQSVYSPRTATPDELAGLRLEDYQAIVIPSLTRLSPKLVRRLSDYVDGGGGLWIGLSPRTEVGDFNRLWYAGGSGVAPLLLEESLAEAPDASDAPIRIAPFVADHPAMRHLGRIEQLDLGEVAITHHRQFQSAADDSTPALMTTSNGAVLATARSLGDGRAIVQAIPLRRQWSDLVLSQAFVVMAQDWLEWLCEPTATQHNLALGDPISFTLSPGDDVPIDAVLTMPDGREQIVKAYDHRRGPTFWSKQTRLPGTYRLELDRQAAPIHFHVARSDLESDLTLLSLEEERLIEDSLRIAGTDETSADRRSPMTPIWGRLLLLLLGVMCLELLLSVRSAVARFGQISADPAGRSAAASPFERAA